MGEARRVRRGAGLVLVRQPAERGDGEGDHEHGRGGGPPARPQPDGLRDDHEQRRRDPHPVVRPRRRADQQCEPGDGHQREGGLGAPDHRHDQHEQELAWSPAQQVVGATYVIVGLLALVAVRVAVTAGERAATAPLG